MSLSDLDWNGVGRSMQVLALGLVLAFFSMTAVGAPSLHATDETPPDLLVGAMGAGSDGTVTHYEDGEQVWQYDGATSYNSVERLSETRVLIAFQSSADGQSCESLETTSCARTGVKILDTTDDSPQPIWNWSFAIRTAHNSEVHDAEMLPDGDIILADMDRERIVEVNHPEGTIAWQWNASEFYDAPPNPGQRDWLHLNDVDYIGDEQYLLSIRNANQLLIVERGAGVVDVINADQDDSNDADCRRPGELVADGDVRCGDPDVLSHQHNPQYLSDRAILVADSENDRAVELRRENGSWSPHWELRAAGGVPLDWPRDADRLPNGQTVVTDTRNARVVSVFENGSVAWSQSIPEQGYDGDVGNEYPAGSAYETAGAFGAGTGQPFEFVERWYGAVRWAVPLPHWVTSWHLLVTIVATVLAVYGTTVRIVTQPSEVDR